MTPFWSRFMRRRALGHSSTGQGPDYGGSWNRLARHDALNAICDGADADRFEEWGRTHGAKLAPMVQHDARILDFGCGIGRMETYLAPHCREIHATDISSEMLAQARRRLASVPNVHLHQLEGPDLSMFADNFFDFAFAMLVFHHVAKADTYLVLREFGRVLRPGGRFFANFPNLLCERYAAVFHDYALRRERAAHRVRPYTPEEVKVAPRPDGRHGRGALGGRRDRGGGDVQPRVAADRRPTGGAIATGPTAPPRTIPALVLHVPQ